MDISKHGKDCTLLIENWYSSHELYVKLRKRIPILLELWEKTVQKTGIFQN